MADVRTYDVLVIGSGPGGEGAAMKCAKAGKHVCLVERHRQVGGGCTHWGTIPSKALRHAIQELVKAHNSPWLRSSIIKEAPRFSDLARTAASVIGRQVSMRTTFYERNRVDVVQGEARFLDDSTLEIS